MRCNHCGTENEEGAVFCENCGQKIEAAAEPAPAPQPTYSQPAPPQYSQPQYEERPFARSNVSNAYNSANYIKCGKYLLTSSEKIMSTLSAVAAFVLTGYCFLLFLFVGAFAQEHRYTMWLMSDNDAAALGTMWFKAIGLFLISIIGGILIIKHIKWSYVLMIIVHAVNVVTMFITGFAAADIIMLLVSIGAIVLQVILLNKMSDTAQATRS